MGGKGSGRTGETIHVNIRVPAHIMASVHTIMLNTGESKSAVLNNLIARAIKKSKKQK